MVDLDPELLDIRRQLAPSDEALEMARERRETVLEAAGRFPGVLRGYVSGSLAHRTANCPIHVREEGFDVDCGVVLDRRSYPSLGPDSVDGVGPKDVVASMVAHLKSTLAGNSDVTRIETTKKRSIKFWFASTTAENENPTVDLIVAITRKSGDPGLWIPNFETGSWDAADPERHTELLTAEPAELRRLRAHAIRLVKAAVKRETPVPVCSFNVEALALEVVDANQSETDAVLQLVSESASRLRAQETEDPAGVSGPIRVPDRDHAVNFFHERSRALIAALAAKERGDSQAMRSALRQVWPDFVAQTPGASSTAQIASKIARREPVQVSSAGLLGMSGGAEIKSTRSYGA